MNERAAPELVYRQYDRAALDREYDNQAKIGVDQFRSFLQHCQAMNDRARKRWRFKLDVPYGRSTAESVDLFFPDAAGPAPVEVFFHGGYWRMMDKRDFSYIADGFGPHGRLTVIVNYALVPTVSLDELVAQCQRAMAWVHRSIAGFGGDPGQVSISGHSAGGHIVAMLLAAGWEEQRGTQPRGIVRAATALSGLYDLEPIRLGFLNDILGLSLEVAERNSPCRLRPRIRAPLLLGVGGREGTEYIRQSKEFAAAWAAEGYAPALQIFEQDDHFTLREQLGDPESAVVSSMMRQRKSLGGDAASRSAYEG